MPSTPVHYSQYIKQGISILCVLCIALFGIKSCRKHQKKRDVIIELSSTASESAAYEQFYQENAHSNLYKSMHHMYLGVQLELTPPEILQAVMEEDEAMFSTENRPELSIRQTLIRDSLLSNYDNCIKLGIFTDPNNIASLSRGEAPTIMTGPATGETTVIQSVIPGSVLPGVNKLLPNLLISPPAGSIPNKAKNALFKFDNFEITRAKNLAKSLTDASLIEKEAYKKIIKFYDQVTAANSEASETP